MGTILKTHNQEIEKYLKMNVQLFVKVSSNHMRERKNCVNITLNFFQELSKILFSFSFFLFLILNNNIIYLFILKADIIIKFPAEFNIGKRFYTA